MQIAVLRGENAMAKTLQTAVETLERDKAQLQSRVHSLEQRLMGTQASEGGDQEPAPSGQEMFLTSLVCDLHSRSNVFAEMFLDLWCVSAGDAALEQLKEEKEFAEGQVKLSGRFPQSV